MALAVGNRKVQKVKTGSTNIIAMYLGAKLVWSESEPEPDPDPGGDIDTEKLKAVLSVITMGYWQDVLPWKDEMPWIDKLTFG